MEMRKPCLIRGEIPRFVPRVIRVVLELDSPEADVLRSSQDLPLEQRVVEPNVLFSDFLEQISVVFGSKKWFFFVFKLFGDLICCLESILDAFWYVLVLKML